MKKLAIFAALAIATPVFACPNMDHDNDQRTADNKKDEKPVADKAKAKEAPKADPKKDEKPATDTAKAKDAAPKTDKAKDTAKKPDKVSSK